MIRIQHEERKRPQQLPGEGLPCKWNKVGGCRLEDKNLKDQTTLLMQNITRNGLKTELITGRREVGCKGKWEVAKWKIKCELKLSLKLVVQRPLHRLLSVPPQEPPGQKCPFSNLILNKSSQWGLITFVLEDLRNTPAILRSAYKKMHFKTPAEYLYIFLVWYLMWGPC